MRLLHTSDWHLGRTLYNRPRYEEFSAFLDWLIGCIQTERIDALLVAGDVFDNTTPSHRTQKLYYRFLHRLADTGCRHVVIIGGNHDSPSLLDAPRELLKFLNVHVIGGAQPEPADELLILRDRDEQPELIVCAVPYLRDRDIRQAEAGESVQDKERKLISGIRAHYHAVCELAEQYRSAYSHPVPIVALGHLFTAGGQTIDGDGVRDLYVGSLAHIGSEVFPACIGYLALGHLHVAQTVAGYEHMRYCGSPIPMGFGEAGQDKAVLKVAFENLKPSVQAIILPRFQALERIKGDWDTIQQRLQALRAEQSQAWLEIIYQGDEIIGQLRERLDEIIQGSRLEILRIKQQSLQDRALSQTDTGETLDQLSLEEVFQRCLDAYAVPPAQRSDLLAAYREIVVSLQEDDAKAE